MQVNEWVTSSGQTVMSTTNGRIPPKEAEGRGAGGAAGGEAPGNLGRALPRACPAPALPRLSPTSPGGRRDAVVLSSPSSRWVQSWEAGRAPLKACAWWPLLCVRLAALGGPGGLVSPSLTCILPAFQTRLLLPFSTF